MDTETTVRIETREPGEKEQTTEETADGLLRQMAARLPEAVAFADPPNRAGFGIGAARSVRFSEADALANRIAARLAAHDLKPGDTIAFQLPNVWESAVLTIAAWRAGLIAVPLPMMWRLNELHHAVAQINPQAIVTIGRFADHDHAETICEAATHHISVRYIFGLGGESRDGVTPVDDWFEDGAGDEEGSAEPRPDGSAGDLAIMTWAASGSGVYPVPRTHAELIKLGQVAVGELKMTGDDVLLNTYPLTGISAVAGQLMPCLLVGASLNFHLPFDYDTFVAQLRDRAVTYTAVPGPVIAALMERGEFDSPGMALSRIGCICLSPHHVTDRDTISGFPVPVYNIHNLGELALIIRQENFEQEITGLPLGRLPVPGSGPEEEAYLETRIRGSVSEGESNQRLEGELFVRGTAVPSGPLDKAGALTQNLLIHDSHGYLNTRIRCAVDDTMGGHFRCERDSELLYHGGVAVGAGELDHIYADYPDFLDTAAFAIEDPIMGERIFAAVVPRPDHTPSLADFRRFLAGKGVAAYKAPDQLVIVNSIPRSTGGTVLRNQILDQV